MDQVHTSSSSATNTAVHHVDVKEPSHTNNDDNAATANHGDDDVMESCTSGPEAAVVSHTNDDADTSATIQEQENAATEPVEAFPSSSKCRGTCDDTYVRAPDIPILPP